MERTAPQPHKIAVFCSGISRGSNLKALHTFFTGKRLPVEIALVIFTRKDSPAYAMASELGLNCIVVPAKDKLLFESRALELVQTYQVELIALAGFLKQLSGEFISSVQVPILNIHPALLPKYGGKGMYGMAVHKAVFAAGEKLSGASIHLVDPLYDHGTIISQKQTDISMCQSPEDIAHRVLQVEHELYAPTIYDYLINTCNPA